MDMGWISEIMIEVIEYLNRFVKAIYVLILMVIYVVKEIGRVTFITGERVISRPIQGMLLYPYTVFCFSLSASRG